MIENKNQRTYESALYEDSGKLIRRIHAGHIHYKNDLLVGDGDDSTLRKVDSTLIRDDIFGGWYFEYNSFHPWIPDYADDWIEFNDVFEGKNQTVRYKPLCQHIKGQLINNEVLYENAFGPGIDLLVYPTRSQLKKEVIIREAVKENKEYQFDFELEIPSAIVLDCVSDDTSRTHIKPILCWDDKRQSRTPYKFVWVDGRRILRKIVTAEFMSGSFGDVHTDTTTSYYAGAGDGSIYGQGASGASWQTTRDMSTGTAAYPSNATVTIQNQYYNGPIWTFSRGYLPVNTAAVPDDAVISQIDVKVYFFSSGVVNTGSNGTIKLVTETQASTDTLTTSDYSAINSTEYASVNLSAITGNGYKTFTSSDNSIISKTGYTKFGLRTGLDQANSAPTGWTDGQGHKVNFAASETASTTSDPYVDITYTVPDAFVPIVIFM